MRTRVQTYIYTSKQNANKSELIFSLKLKRFNNEIVLQAYLFTLKKAQPKMCAYSADLPTFSAKVLTAKLNECRCSTQSKNINTFFGLSVVQ